MPEIRNLEELKELLSKDDAETSYTFLVTLLDGRGNLIANPVKTHNVHSSTGGLIVLPEDQNEDATTGHSTMYPWHRVFSIEASWKPKVVTVEPEDPSKPTPYL